MVGLYSSVTVVQILNGKHYNLALDACTLNLLASSLDVWIETFNNGNPTLYQKYQSLMEVIGKACSYGLDVTEAHCQLVSLISTLELDKRIEEFGWKNDKYPMYNWAHMYMKQVSNLL